MLRNVNSSSLYSIRCLPVKVDQKSSDVVVFLRSGFETDSSVCYSLESGEKMVGNAVQQAVPIVKARHHVGMDHKLCGFPVKKISNSSKTVEMEIFHTTNVLHVVVHA